LKTRKIKLNGGRTIQVLKTDDGIIIRRGCSHCGHGLCIYNNTNFGICAWEGRTYDLNSDFIKKLREKNLIL